MTTTWRLILLGPADLERSIVESALRQAGFQLAVLGHLEDYYTAIEAPGVHGVLVTGDRVGREPHPFDFEADIVQPARRRQVSVIAVGDRPAAGGVTVLARPLKFPAAARTISDALEQQQRLSLDGGFNIRDGRLRDQLARASSVGWSGTMILDSPELPGELRFARGQIGAVHVGGLTGAEALAVLLGIGDGAYHFQRRDDQTGEYFGDYSELENDADSIRLTVAEMMSRAPDGPIEVNPDRLIARLGRLSDEVAWVFRLIDGQRNLSQLWTLGGSTAVAQTMSLIDDGILVIGSDDDLSERRRAWVEAIEAQVGSPDSTNEFAWKVAVGDEFEASMPSLKEEGWADFEKADDWDQLPDFDLGIEGALQEADAYFKSIAPEGVDENYSIEQALVDMAPDIPLSADSVVLPEPDDEMPADNLFEPILGGHYPATVPPVVMATQEFEAPPVIAEIEFFDDGLELGDEPGFVDEAGETGEWAPLDDELGQLLAEEQPDQSRRREPLGDNRFHSDARPSGPSRHFGAGADLGDGHLVGLEDALAGIEAKKLGLRGRVYLTLLAIALGSTAAISTYQYSKRIRAIGSSPTVIPWDPSMKLDGGPKSEPEEKPAEAESAKKPAPDADAGPPKAQATQPKRRSNRRRRGRRRRRMRHVKRAKVGNGKFAKTLQNARMLRDDGNLEAALSGFTKAVSAAGSAAERSVALSERGEARYSLGDHGGAISDLRGAIATDGENGFALKNLGLIEYQRFKAGDASARKRATTLLNQYVALIGRADAAVQRWLRDLE